MAMQHDKMLDSNGPSRGLKLENLQKMFQALASGDEKKLNEVADKMAEMGMRPPPPELIDAIVESMSAHVAQQQQQPPGVAQTPENMMAAAQSPAPDNASALAQLLQGQVSGGDSGALEQLLQGNLNG